MAKFKPPTLKEMLDYQKVNPELSGLDIPFLYKAYTENDWHDTQDKPVKRWKMKLWTLSRYNPPKLCGICGKPAVKYQIKEGKRFYICNSHLPKETPQYHRQESPKKNEEMITRDKVQEQIDKLAEKMKA